MWQNDWVNTDRHLASYFGSAVPQNACDSCLRYVTPVSVTSAYTPSTAEATDQWRWIGKYLQQTDRELIRMLSHNCFAEMRQPLSRLFSCSFQNPAHTALCLHFKHFPTTAMTRTPNHVLTQSREVCAKQRTALSPNSEVPQLTETSNPPLRPRKDLKKFSPVAHTAA